jgi:hypothetical protein
VEEEVVLAPAEEAGLVVIELILDLQLVLAQHTQLRLE